MRKLSQRRRPIGSRPGRRAGGLCGRPEHERLDRALDVALFGVWDWNLRTGAVRCVGKVAEIFGYPPRTCPTADQIAERIHPDDSEQVMRLTKGPYEIEYRVLLPDASLRWIASRGSVLVDAGGRPYRRVAVLFDITALKRAHDEALRVKDRLERRLARRTELLEDMIRQLEAFSFSVSHDLRAPLRAILNYADLAHGACLGKVDERTTDQLEKIIHAAQRLEKLTHDLLRFTRLSKSAPSIVPVLLSASVAEVLEEYPALEASRAFIQTTEVSGRAAANESLLRQALASLLENAVKFQDPSRPLSVRVWTEDKEDRVRLCVRDNGIGIEERHRGRIFLPFERLQPGSGTGMGLALAKRAVERMGGSVGFESDPGKGSTFWLELPKA